MKIKVKLFLGFGIILILLIIAGGGGWYGLDELEDGINTVSRYLNMNNYIADGRNGVGNMEAASLRLIVYKDKAYYDKATERLKQSITGINNAKKLMYNQNHIKQADEVEEKVAEYYKVIDSWWQLEQKGEGLLQQLNQKTDSIIAIMTELIGNGQNNAKVAAEENAGKIGLERFQRNLIYNNARNALYIAGKVQKEVQIALEKEDILKLGELWNDKIKESKALLVQAHDAASSANKEIIVKAQEELEGYREIGNEYINTGVEMSDLYGMMREYRNTTMGLVREIRDSVSGRVNNAVSSAVLSAGYLITLIICIMFAAVILGCFTAVILTRMIIKPVQAVMVGAKQVSVGDLNVQLAEGRDEMGQMGAVLNLMIKQLQNRSEQAAEIAEGNLDIDVSVASEKDSLGLAFHKMVGNLNHIIRRVLEATTQVSIAASEVSSASQSLSQGSTETAASLEEITASMAELGSRTNTNAENATQANLLAGATAEAATAGLDRMNELTVAMEGIQSDAMETQRVIKAIDDIAFQTNLLALNAAVEAARAGVHGKGFAVVAEEVRNLAARSAKAAQETATLIENSNRQINEGVDISKQTADALNEIADNVKKTTDLIGEIAVASNEQAQGISQVNIGLGQVDTVTQTNTANSEETAAAAEEMASQADMLKHQVSKFNLKDVGMEQLQSAPQSANVPDKIPAPAVMQKEMIDPREQIDLDDDEFGKF